MTHSTTPPPPPCWVIRAHQDLSCGLDFNYHPIFLCLSCVCMRWLRIGLHSCSANLLIIIIAFLLTVCGSWSTKRITQNFPYSRGTRTQSLERFCACETEISVDIWSQKLVRTHCQCLRVCHGRLFLYEFIFTFSIRNWGRVCHGTVDSLVIP